MGEIEEEGTRHFSVALIDRTRGNGYSLEGMKLHLNKRKTFFFTVREIRPWKRFPREVVHSLSLEILKI